MTYSFPKNFLWGTATAAHQVEGNNINSDGWLLEHLPDSPFAEPSGDACDHYHRYPEHIALLADLGLNAFQISFFIFNLLELICLDTGSNTPKVPPSY